MPTRKHLDHEVPPWVESVPEFFVTVCAEPRGQNHFCHPEIGRTVIDSIRIYHEKQTWHCEVAVLMPDHIHLIISVPDDKSLSKVVGLWKRVLARNHKISWQRNFFDHRLRQDESGQEKWTYILNNPVRAGLIDEPMKWPFFWMPGRD